METTPVTTPTPPVLSDDQSTRDRRNARRRELRKQKAAAEQAKAEHAKKSQSICNKRSYRKKLGDDAGVAEATRELDAHKANKAAFIAQKTQELLSTMNTQNNGTPDAAMQGTPTTSNKHHAADGGATPDATAPSLDGATCGSWTLSFGIRSVGFAHVL